MAARPKTGIQGRLKEHSGSEDKTEWTHFSVYQVWENIRQEEVRELEGFIRHIYRTHKGVNSLNSQRSFKKLKKLTVKNLKNLKE